MPRAGEQPDRRPCPRCGYDLRGQIEPRCPECGLTFGDADWTETPLRENAPGRLDGVDLWQPHRVLLAGLAGLVAGMRNPPRAAARLNLRGPATPALAALVAGVLWLYATCVLLLAGAILRETNASPYLALKAAAVWWAPRLLALGLSAATGALGAVLDRRTLGARVRLGRAGARLAGYWLPAALGWTILPLALLILVAPDFALPLRGYLTLLGCVPVLWTQLAAPRARWVRVFGRQRVVNYSGAALWFASAAILSWLVLPDGLDPPIELCS